MPFCISCGFCFCNLLGVFSSPHNTTIRNCQNDILIIGLRGLLTGLGFIEVQSSH